MHVGRSNKAYDYSLDGLVLKEAETEKDLGMIISNDLKVSHQCLSAYNKANRILGINRMIVYKTKEIMLRLYKSAVREYCNCTAAWSPYYLKDKELIERILHKFTRMISEINDLPYMERLHQLNCGH